MAGTAAGIVLRGGVHWRRWLPLAILVPLLSAMLLVDHGFSAAALTPALWTVVFVVLALRPEDVVRLTDDGIAVSKRRKPERLYRWDDLLEVGWGPLDRPRPRETCWPRPAPRTTSRTAST
jgi:hypothetical protein